MLVSPLLPQDGATPLIFAAANGATETAAMLIDRGADLEAKSSVRRKQPSENHYFNSLSLYFLFLILIFPFFRFYKF